MPDAADTSQENAQLREQLAAAESRLSTTQRELASATEQNEKLAANLAWLKRQLFGRKSERAVPEEDPPEQGQLPLAAQEEALIDAAAAAAALGAKKKGGSKKGRATRAQRLPAGLPVRETIILPPEVEAAPHAWRRMGEEITERLGCQPGELYIERTVRPKFVPVDQPHCPPIAAPAPAALAEGQFFTAGLIVEIVLGSRAERDRLCASTARRAAAAAAGNYLSHQPLYRQAQTWRWTSGVDLPLSTLCGAVGSAAHAAEGVVLAMAQDMWASGNVQIDLSPVRCLGGTKASDGAAPLGQMWVAAQPRGDIIYHWRLSKEARHAQEIIPAGYCGILQCDGGSEIAAHLLGGKKSAGGHRPHPPPPGIERACCLAHVRRKFEDAWTQSGRQCAESGAVLGLIRELYAVEEQGRVSGLEGPGLWAARAAARQTQSVPVMARLHESLKAAAIKHRPKSLLGKACAYALSQWESLQVFLKHGHCEIDNNLVENGIRPCALGKKNCLFIGSAATGTWAATFYSLVGSCLRRGINPRKYLNWLFERLPGATSHTQRQLTPAAYAASAAETPGSAAANLPEASTQPATGLAMSAAPARAA